MRLFRRALLIGIVIAIGLAPHATAQDAGDTPRFEVPYIEDPSIEADGDLDAAWQDAEMQQLEMQGYDGTEGSTFVQVYMVHNLSHYFVLVIGERLETVTLQFDANNGDDARGESLDGLRVTADGAEDLDYDAEQGWVADPEDCQTAAEGARAEQDSSAVFETARALEGDACDMFVPAGETIGFRLLATRGDDTYRWPADTDELDPDGGFDEELSEWGQVSLQSGFGDTDQEVPSQGDEQQGDAGRVTDERPGVDGDQQVDPDAEGPADPYDPGEDDRETPAPGLAALVLTGALMLLAVSRARRSR